MQTGAKGIALIKEFEGCKLTAYLCTGNRWTLGYGHTSGVKEGDTCTQEQADAWLVSDLVESESAVTHLATITLTQNQFDALVSFTFNLGQGRLSASTLLKKLNAGDATGAADEFLRWNKSGGSVTQGLTRRREAERALFLAE